MKINQIVVTENQQLDELSWADIKNGANKIQQGAQNFQQNVADTGNAVAGAANAIGGAGKELAKQTIARPVGAAYNAVKGAAGAAADTVANTYGDVKKGVQAVGQGVSTAQKDLGNAAKFVGKSAADAIGGVGQAVGAAASVPQGVGRAVKGGYNAGVQAIGGPDKDAAQPAAGGAQGTAPAGGQTSSLGNGQAAGAEGEPENVKYIQQQIDTKEKEIQTLKSQLAAVKDVGKSTAKSSSSTTGGNQNKTADTINDFTNAMRAGVGMGAAGQSLMSPKPGDDMQTIKDKSGKDHQYKKVGDKWMDMATNKEVDLATAAMLDKQKGATPAPTQAQQQSQDQEKEEPAKAPAADNNPGKVGHGFNSQTGKPYASAEEKEAGEAENAKNSAPTAQQVQNRADAKAANPFGFNDQTGEAFKSQEEADKFNAAREKDEASKQGGEQEQPAVWKNNRNPNGPAATSPQAAADQAAQAQQNPAVWKNNRAPEGTPASTSPQAAAATAQPQVKDVQARMTNQLGATPAGIPAKDGQQAATPNFGQQATGYGKTTYNAPTGGVPQQPAIQPTTGAKAVPQEPAALAAAPAQTASAQADQGKPGFLQSKIKGQQPALAEMDFSAILAKRTKIQL